MIEELQRTVITLSRENKDLNERNEQLRRQLIEIGGKVRIMEDLISVFCEVITRHQHADGLRFTTTITIVVMCHVGKYTSLKNFDRVVPKPRHLYYINTILLLS